MSNPRSRLDLFERWLVALRSGEYEQGKDVLRRGREFCCLGVACDLIDPEGWSTAEIPAWRDVFCIGLNREAMLILGFDRSWGELPRAVTYRDKSETRLAVLNDAGMPFPEIADVIEEQFVKPLREELGVGK